LVRFRLVREPLTIT